MTTVILILIGTVVLAVWQGWLIRNLANVYSQPQSVWPTETPLPKVAVILSLRGRDPYLDQCLRNLIKQDYPDFQIYLVVDSETDPAWDSIRKIRSEFGDVMIVDTLKYRRPTCSLKNSSLIQAINALPLDVEVVALVDADAIVSPTWIRSLVAPMANPEVGCTTGIRWFAPTESSFGSRLRCYWNHVAASMIHASHIPWGGSMAVRRNLLDEGLADEWSRMFCEDAHTINYLRRKGVKLVYVPEATIPNREDVSVASCIRFVNRQMLIFRLYNSNWNWLVLSIFLAASLRITHDLLIVKALILTDFFSLACLVCCHPLILLVTRYEVSRLDRIVRQTVKNQGQVIPSNPLPDLFGYFCVEIVFLTSVIAALFTQFAVWRGIRYRIRGPEEITLLGYSPYHQPDAAPVVAETTVV